MPKIILTQEENNITQYLCNVLNNDLFDKGNKRNVYAYNEQFYLNITEQQQKNDINLSIGLKTTKILSQGGSKNIFDEETKKYIKTQISMNYLKNFEIHVFSVKKSAEIVSQRAEIIRKALYYYSNTYNMPDMLYSNYYQLDNTGLACNDCYFNFDVITKEIYEVKYDQIAGFDPTIVPLPTTP